LPKNQEPLWISNGRALREYIHLGRVYPFIAITSSVVILHAIRDKRAFRPLQI